METGQVKMEFYLGYWVVTTNEARNNYITSPLICRKVIDELHTLRTDEVVEHMRRSKKIVKSMLALPGNKCSEHWFSVYTQKKLTSVLILYLNIF